MQITTSGHHTQSWWRRMSPGSLLCGSTHPEHTIGNTRSTSSGACTARHQSPCIGWNGRHGAHRRGRPRNHPALLVRPTIKLHLRWTSEPMQCLTCRIALRLMREKGKYYAYTDQCCPHAWSHMHNTASVPELWAAVHLFISLSWSS